MRVKRFLKCTYETCGGPWVGQNGRDKMKMDYHILDEFLKEEINRAKYCGCPHCECRKNLLRKIQYIVKDHKKIQEDTKK